MPYIFCAFITYNLLPLSNKHTENKENQEDFRHVLDIEDDNVSCSVQISHEEGGGAWFKAVQVDFITVDM